MLRFLFNPDAGNLALNQIFTICSMGLSAFCGWTLAEDNNPVIQTISAGILAMVAFALAVHTQRWARYKESLAVAQVAQDRVAYRQAQRELSGYWWFLPLLIAINFATDFSASSTIRDMSNVLRA